MNEHDANRALIDAAALRDCPHIRNYDGLCAMCDMPMPDPLEQTQRMPVADRRYRQNEAKQQRVDAQVDDMVRRQGWALTVAEPSELRDIIRGQSFAVILDRLKAWRVPVTCDRCGNTPCPGCNPCCGSTLGRDPEDGSCRGCG